MFTLEANDKAIIEDPRSTIIDRAAEMRAEGRLDDLFLLTSRKCEAAIHLYEKYGFVHDPDVLKRVGPRYNRYNRCDVAMSYPLSDG